MADLQSKKISELTTHDMSTDSGYDSLVGVTEVEVDGEKQLQTVRVPMSEIIHRKGEDYVPGTTEFETVKVREGIHLTNKIGEYWVYVDDDGKLVIDINGHTGGIGQALMKGDDDSVCWGNPSPYGLSSYSISFQDGDDSHYMSEVKECIESNGGDITKMNSIFVHGRHVLIKFTFVGNMYYVYAFDWLNLKSYNYCIDLATTTIADFFDKDSVAVGGFPELTIDTNEVEPLSTLTDAFESAGMTSSAKKRIVRIQGRGNALLLCNAFVAGNSWVVFATNFYNGKRFEARNIDPTTISLWDFLNPTGEYVVKDSSSPMTPITYAELKALRDSGSLVSGMFYRITDYQCTTSQEGTRATDHRFDIIVQALSNNKLSEIAKVDFNAEDSYFADNNANLAAWEIKYCLDNDTTRFAWALDGQAITNLESMYSNGQPLVRQPSADGLGYGEYQYAWGTKADADDGDNTNFWYSKNEVITDCETVWSEGEEQIARVIEGKGVIYYMKDEHGNECPYDFKNIQFKRVITLDNGYPEYDPQGGHHSQETWVYTFCGNSYHIDNDEWSELKDGSLESPYGHESDEGTSTFQNNIVKPYIKFYDNENEDYTKCGMQYLNNNVFLGWWEEIGSTSPDDCPYYYGYCCYNNTFDNHCYNNTFGYGCSNNTFGYGCYNNTFDRYCINNTFGVSCSDNTFGVSCSDNTFGVNCSNNTFGYNCYDNTFDRYCYDNTFGYGCFDTVFGEGCTSNAFARGCSENHTASQFVHNTLEKGCWGNTFIGVIRGLYMEGHCSENTITAKDDDAFGVRIRWRVANRTFEIESDRTYGSSQPEIEV